MGSRTAPQRLGFAISGLKRSSLTIDMTDSKFITREKSATVIEGLVKVLALFSPAKRRRFLVAAVMVLGCRGLQPIQGADSPSPTNDLYCSATIVYTNGSAIRPQAASTLRMVERLAKLPLTPEFIQSPYANEAKVNYLKQVLPRITNASQRIPAMGNLADQLLFSGHPEEALQQYAAAEEFAKKLNMVFSPETQSGLRMAKATALLRLGEQENCLVNHNAKSCYLPLEPAGFHQLSRGSRGAIELFTEQLGAQPNDLSARWLLNLAYMTLGEYPNKVPSSWLIPTNVFASDYALPRFPEIAGSLGLDVDDLAGGCIVEDFDNDGFLDIVTSAMGVHSQMHYFHNDGNGHFSDRTREAGLLGLTGGLNIQQTDYNNDGWPDIWVLRGGWMGKAGKMPKSLLRNNRDGTFTDVTEEAGLLCLHPSQTSVWFDFDGDGWLDLFVGSESSDLKDPEPCELYRNNRNGTFTACASVCGLRVVGYVKGVASADYDNDGRPDLYISLLDGANRLFHNDGPDASGQWHFSDVARKAGVENPLVSFPTWFFDYDNDGWEDIFVSGYHVDSVGDVAADYLGLTNHGVMPKLYHNNHDGTFTDVTTAAHLNHVFLTMGCNFGDLDNDGWLDFYLGTGNPSYQMLIPKRMYRNAQGKYFQDVTTSGGFGQLQKGHAVAFADLDNDGNQDIFQIVGGAYAGDHYHSALFLNPGSTNHWIKLKLEGRKSNRAAIGARIRVHVNTPEGPRDIFKTVNSGGSFGSSPLRQEIGLGNATGITEIEIKWPASGMRQVLKGLELDQCYHAWEGDTEAQVWKLKQLRFDTTAQSPIHAHSMEAGH